MQLDAGIHCRPFDSGITKWSVIKMQEMEKIPSFTVNHLELMPGLYVSRKDHVGSEILTTFDIRITRPNLEPVMDTPAVHTIEHLGATFLRNNDEWKNRVIYFGPMGCRTGFYLILAGDLNPYDIFDLMHETFSFIDSYEGEIPGASPKDCGNYLDHNLPMARYYARKYLDEVLCSRQDERMSYPESKI